MQRIGLFLFGAALILGSSVVHGVWTMRWTDPLQFRAAGASVALIPAEFGNWTSEEMEIKKKQMDQAGAVGYLMRRYVNSESGQVIVVMLLCGHTGPLSSHTPAICFPATGMTMIGPEKRCAPRRYASRDWGEYFWADFRGTNWGIISRVRLFWAWSTDGGKWQSPDHPRMTLAGNPYLFKIFIHRDLDQVDPKDSNRESLNDDPCVAFLREFLPEVKKAARAGIQDGKASDKI